MVDLEKLGLSYRQLDYWARKGHLRPYRNKVGTGIHRQWPDRELQIAGLMSYLITHGLSLEAAAKLARDAKESESNIRTASLEMAPGLHLVIDLEVIDKEYNA